MIIIMLYCICIMELLILPAIGIAGMYCIKKQNDEIKAKKEGFETLPNTNVPDKNYPSFFAPYLASPSRPRPRALDYRRPPQPYGRPKG
jgi:hypothetical protein